MTFKAFTAVMIQVKNFWVVNCVMLQYGSMIPTFQRTILLPSSSWSVLCHKGDLDAGVEICGVVMKFPEWLYCTI